MSDRLEKLLRVFAEAGRMEDGPTIQDLADGAGVDTDVLTPKYVRERQHRLETLQRIVGAAAVLLSLNEKQLDRWLGGKKEPRIDQQIDQRLRLHRMTREARHRSPAQNRWLQEVEQKIGTASPKLRQAWEAAKAQRLAINYIRLAALAKMSIPTFRRAWADSGLPARPIPGRPRHTRSLVRLIRKRRSPSRRYGDGEGQMVLGLAEAA